MGNCNSSCCQSSCTTIKTSSPTVARPRRSEDYERPSRNTSIALRVNDGSYRSRISPDDDGNRRCSRNTDGTEQSVASRSELTHPAMVAKFDRHFLTRCDRLLIAKSWKKTQKTGADHIGSKIFLRVLTVQPEIKAIFGLEKIPQGRLKYDPQFRQHALVYTKTFDFIVQNLERPTKLEAHFEALGRRHVQYQGRGFDPSYWDTFAECMTQSAAEWEHHRHRPTTSAWRRLVSTIIMFMRRGFDEEIGRKKSTAIMIGMPMRKSSACLPTQCSFSSAQLYPTKQQYLDVFSGCAFDNQRKYSMDSYHRRSSSQIPIEFL